MGERKYFEAHGALDRVMGTPTTKDEKNSLMVLHWLLDGNIGMVHKHDPYLWYTRHGIEVLLKRGAPRIIP